MFGNKREIPFLTFFPLNGSFQLQLRFEKLNFSEKKFLTELEHFSLNSVSSFKCDFVIKIVVESFSILLLI